MANTKLLLVKDVMDLGRSGDIVAVKPGYARNYLLPQKLGMIADKNTLRMQARLQEERLKQAEKDRQESDILAQRLEDVTLAIEVKVDHDGHMYGSVSVLDIVNVLREKEGIEVDKRWVLLKQPIKALGAHTIEFKLLEGVPASINLKIHPEGGPIPTPVVEEAPKVEGTQEEV